MSRTRTLIAVATLTAVGLGNAALAAQGTAPRNRTDLRASAAPSPTVVARAPVGGPRPLYMDGPFVSTRTRAEVAAEAAVATARGEIPHGELGRIETVRAQPAAAPTRAEVRAETRLAMRLDQIPDGETSAYR